VNRFTLVGSLAWLSLLLVTGSTKASSSDAWDEFRETLVQKCRAAANAGDDSLVQFEPFGSASYGVAIIYTPRGRQVCVMDKQSTELEITEPF
jgi:hypothetical protein